PLEDRIILTSEMKAPGSGVLKELSAGTPLTVRDLATLMIIVSDNTATDILLGLVTKEAVNSRLRACGLERTTVAMSCRELLCDLVGLGGAPDTLENRQVAAERLNRRATDPGIRSAPKSPCIVTVFTRDLADALKGRMASAQVGQAVYEAYS